MPYEGVRYGCTPPDPDRSVKIYVSESPQADAFGELLETIGLRDIALDIIGLDPQDAGVRALLNLHNLPIATRVHVLAVFSNGRIFALLGDAEPEDYLQTIAAPDG